MERLLDEETKREEKYWEEVDKKKDQMTDVCARKRKTRKDMLDDHFTDEDREEFAAKYRRLQNVYKLAEEEIESLEKRLAEAGLTIKRLRKMLAEVRKELEEQQKHGHDLEMTVNGLRQEVKTLHESLDVAEDRLKEYEQKYTVLAGTDISTPTSSEVSLETPEDGPVTQGRVVAESSRRQRSQTQVDNKAQVDRDGSPPEKIKDSDAGPPLAKTHSGSSGTQASQREKGEIVARVSQSKNYPGVLPGTTVVKETVKTIHKSPRHNHKKRDSRGKK